MTRLLRPAMAGIALLVLAGGIISTANPAFADKSAKIAVTDEKTASVTVTDDKSAGITVSLDDKSAGITLTPADKSA